MHFAFCPLKCFHAAHVGLTGLTLNHLRVIQMYLQILIPVPSSKGRKKYMYSACSCSCLNFSWKSLSRTKQGQHHLDFTSTPKQLPNLLAFGSSQRPLSTQHCQHFCLDTCAVSKGASFLNTRGTAETDPESTVQPFYRNMNDLMSHYPLYSFRDSGLTAAVVLPSLSAVAKAKYLKCPVSF